MRLDFKLQLTCVATCVSDSCDLPSLLNLLQVATTVVEMPNDAAVKLWDDDINKRIFDLMHSQNNMERLGGLLAIGTPVFPSPIVDYIEFLTKIIFWRMMVKTSLDQSDTSTGSTIM